MMNTTTYSIWILEHFGRLLAFGGNGSRYFKGVRHCRRLAKRIGEPAAKVQAEIAARYREIAD